VSTSCPICGTELCGIDATGDILWKDGQPLIIGLETALPAAALIALLFAPSIQPGFTLDELRKASQHSACRKRACAGLGRAHVRACPFPSYSSRRVKGMNRRSVLSFG
jgi:hypothetical protein